MEITRKLRKAHQKKKKMEQEECEEGMVEMKKEQEPRFEDLRS